jgi:4-hydroxybenzoate polyprenyltransferase
MKLFLTVFDGFFLTRPILWMPVWSFCIFGYWCAAWSGQAPDITLLWHAGQVMAFLWILAFSASVGAVYVFNQISDYDVDAINGGFPLLVFGTISKKQALSFAIGLAAASTLICCLSGWRLSVLALAAVILGLTYSFKPFYWTGRPFSDFIANAAGYGIIAFAAGWTLAGLPILSWQFVEACLPYFLLMCGGSISSTLPDYTGDKAQNKRTTAVVFGIRQAHWMATAFILAAGLVAAVRGDPVALLCAAFAFPLYILFSLHPSQRTMEATYKIGGGIFMLISAAVFPIFAAAAVLTVVGTLYYFRKRHNVHFPSLMPATHVPRH